MGYFYLFSYHRVHTHKKQHINFSNELYDYNKNKTLPLIIIIFMNVCVVELL